MTLVDWQPIETALRGGGWVDFWVAWVTWPADGNGMSCDFKRDNFGTIDGKVVLLDFGEYP